MNMGILESKYRADTFYIPVGFELPLEKVIFADLHKLCVDPILSNRNMLIQSYLRDIFMSVLNVENTHKRESNLENAHCMTFIFLMSVVKT